MYSEKSSGVNPRKSCERVAKDFEASAPCATDPGAKGLGSSAPRRVTVLRDINETFLYIFCSFQKYI